MAETAVEKKPEVVQEDVKEETTMQSQPSDEEKVAKQMEDSGKAADAVKQNPELVEQPRVKISEDIAFQLRIQQFEKEIAVAKERVASLERQKAEFIFNRNVEVMTKQGQEELLRQQIEAETKRRMSVPPQILPKKTPDEQPTG